MTAAEKSRLIARIPVADALTYLFGTVGFILFCSYIGPWLLRADLKADGRRLEAAMGFTREGAALIHVPCKGGGPVAAAVVSGETPVASAALAPAIPHLRIGKLRALGVASSKRSALAPEIPTFAESGFPIDATIWTGLLAPAKTAAEIIQRLNAEMTRAGQNPELRERLSTAGSEAMMTSTPEEFAAVLRVDLEKYTKIVREANIRFN